MGNWKRRHYRRNYNQEEPLKPHQSGWNNCPQPRPQSQNYHSSSGFFPNNVPSWEMQFCAVVGKVPWTKVVDSKKYMNYYRNILEWDDSAGEEAFHNAKQRFWAHINGLSCDIFPLGPDIYIDDIDYDAYIDSELVIDLDQEYVSHDEEVDGITENDKKRNFSNALSENPWSAELHNNENPWEQSCSHSKGDLKNNTWGDFGGNSWRKNQEENHVNLLIGRNGVDNHWEQNIQGVGHIKGKGREDIINNSGAWGHWEWNNNESINMGGDNSWGQNLGNNALRHASRKEWGDSSNGWKAWNALHSEPKDLESKRVNEEWGTWDANFPKRGDSRQYVTNYKSNGYQGDGSQRCNDHLPSSYWKRGRTNQ